jgi:hypothetical protein
MSMMFRSALALALALALSVAASAPAEASLFPRLAGRTILTGCRQGECAWLRIASVERAGTFPQGELRRMRVRAGSSYHPDGNIPENATGVRIKWEKAERNEYAFCSRVRPAYAFPDRGKLIVHFLDLFDPAGYQYASAGLYMRFCHGREALPSARGLRALGYRPKTRSGQVEAKDAGVMTRF